MKGEPAVELNEIGQIAITVRDLERARAFYREVLGLQFLLDAGTMTFFQCGSIRLMLGLAEEGGAVSGTILYFKVGDIHAAHEALAVHGVVFLQSPHLVAKMPSHELWMAFLKDPEDNTLALMSELPSKLRSGVPGQVPGP